MCFMRAIPRLHPVSLLTVMLLQRLCLAGLSARLTVSPADMESFCGTRNAKLVFASRDPQSVSFLYFVDFSEPVPSIEKMANTDGAALPVISPDGGMVTFVTGVRGDGTTNSRSTVWVCELSGDAEPMKVADSGYVPRFKQNAPTPTIIYSTCNNNGDQPMWNGCGAVIEHSVGSGSTGEVWEGGSYYGGLSWDGRYLAHSESGMSAFILDRESGGTTPVSVHELTVRKEATGEDTTIALQTCNPSISGSRVFTDMIMFYDFSSSGITDAGCSHPILGTWGFHDRIFITGIDKRVRRVYDIPAEPAVVPQSRIEGKGEIVGKQWGFPEWSNHPYYAVSSLQTDRIWLRGGPPYKRVGKRESIYCINLKDSLYLKMVETTDSSYESTVDLQNPWLWIETPAAFASVEDDRWLLHPYGSEAYRSYRASASVDGSPAARRFQAPAGIVGTRLVASNPVKRIVLLRPDGRTMLTAEGNGARTIDIRPLLMRTAEGIVVLRILYGHGAESLIAFRPRSS
mgnify:CR=1 FL=1